MNGQKKNFLDNVLNDKNQVILKLVSVSKIYPIYSPILKRVIFYKQVLQDINLDFYRHKTTGILGESGCGKSTLAKIISSIESVSSGEVFFKNNNIKNFSFKDLATKIQMVFQNPYASLNPKLTIGYLIKERIKQYCKLTNSQISESFIKEKMYEFIEIVKLKKEVVNLYSSQLSGGERQRVAILLAIAMQPELLILDEPLSALDISLQAQMLNFFNEIKNKFNLTYIFITHDVSLAEYFCDKIFKIENGKINEVF